MIRDRINSAARRVPTWVVYTAGLLAGVRVWYLAATGGLGVEPINALIRELGLMGLQLLIASLCITPLRRFAGLNLLRFRRALGLLAFFFILQHLGVWLILDVGDPARVWADIVKRPYVTIGMVGFVAMVPLALTSTDSALRRMGAVRWRQLHRLAYVAAFAGGLHYIWLVKGWPLEPLVYGAAILAILALRLIPRPVHRSA